jgi:hypothetical protein
MQPTDDRTKKPRDGSRGLEKERKAEVYFAVTVTGTLTSPEP